MDKLTHIYVGNNKLTNFPEELSHLKNLEVLCAPCNVIENIPTELSALRRLTQLNLSRNRIKRVPYGELAMVILTDIILDIITARCASYDIVRRRFQHAVTVAAGFVS